MKIFYRTARSIVFSFFFFWVFQARAAENPNIANQKPPRYSIIEETAIKAIQLFAAQINSCWAAHPQEAAHTQNPIRGSAQSATKPSDAQSKTVQPDTACKVTFHRVRTLTNDVKREFFEGCGTQNRANKFISCVKNVAGRLPKSLQFSQVFYARKEKVPLHLAQKPVWPLITASCGNGVVDFGEMCDSGHDPETYTTPESLSAAEKERHAATPSASCLPNCKNSAPGWECYGADTEVYGYLFKKSVCLPVYGDGKKVGDEKCDNGWNDKAKGCFMGEVVAGWRCELKNPGSDYPQDTCEKGKPTEQKKSEFNKNTVLYIHPYAAMYTGAYEGGVLQRTVALPRGKSRREQVGVNEFGYLLSGGGTVLARYPSFSENLPFAAISSARGGYVFSPGKVGSGFEAMLSPLGAIAVNKKMRNAIAVTPEFGYMLIGANAVQTARGRIPWIQQLDFAIPVYFHAYTERAIISFALVPRLGLAAIETPWQAKAALGPASGIGMSFGIGAAKQFGAAEKLSTQDAQDVSEQNSSEQHTPKGG